MKILSIKNNSYSKISNNYSNKLNFKNNDGFSNDEDFFAKRENNVIMIDKNGNLIGKYSKNSQGYYTGFILVNTDLFEFRDLFFDAQTYSDEDMPLAFLRQHLDRKKPQKGYLVRFEQFYSHSSNKELTGLSFYSLADGNKVIHATKNSLDIPTQESLAEIIQSTEESLEKYKNHPEKFLSGESLKAKIKSLLKQRKQKNITPEEQK